MILLISDLHLTPERPAITQAFYYFMEKYTPDADALYILGDFFEVWLGDDDDTPLFQEIQAFLARYSKALPIYIMHGNRDFLLGELFCQRTGVQLLDEETIIDAYGSRYLLIHGDSLCTKDQSYMLFRAAARSQEWQEAFLQQSLEARRAYAKELRANSKTMNSNKSEDIMDVTPDEVVTIMEKYQIQKLVHGHTHRPDSHNLNANNKPATRLVLGDWDHKAWYATIDEHGIQQYSFEIE